MTFDLSPQNEQFLAQAVADGRYPSVHAAVNAAVDALRERSTGMPMVPDEHMAAVEESLDDLEAGVEEKMTERDWEELRQIARVEEGWDVVEEKRRYRERLARRTGGT